ncbi:membrane protein [Raineyella antarctica]|uniref:Membrane protein n=1 Tax=Raineyella antarctica TaxID=1577474 RepID=A0A1G6GZ00_9ACTN|nr:YihY/virulence factor BrkB family protein [Raineyella antarctica]SDB87128.1 membrane protein [Raineyella antarctica]
MSPYEPIDATLSAADAPPPDSDKKPDDPPKLHAPAWKYAFRRALREFSTDGGTDLSAMLTYYTVLSLAPALLAVFSIISLVLASNAASVSTQAGELVGRYLPADYRAPVVDLVNNVTASPAGGVVALVISIAVALWSASAYVKAFSRCMNVIYGRAEGRGAVKQIGTMLMVTLILLVGVVLILVSLALNQALVSGVLGPIAGPLGLGGALDFMLRTFLPVWAWVKWPVILALVVVLVAVLYYFTPNIRQPKFSWVSLGSIVAIVGIALAAVLLSIYLTRFAGYSSYGAIGSMMALLFALWVFNIMLLLGAEVDAEVERARELQAGFEAEGNILLPPRATGRVEKMKEVRDKLEAEGRELRTPEDDQAGGQAADQGAGQAPGPNGSGPATGPRDAERQGDGAPAKLRAEQERRFNDRS